MMSAPAPALRPASHPSDNRRAGPSSSEPTAVTTQLDLEPETPAQRRMAGLKRKFKFMTHLMTNLDALVYAELCALYYMDCSFFRLLIRLVVQSFFLSPKSEEFVMLMPQQRPHVVAILVPNVLCMLLHLLTSLPQAGEAARGYLHGGIIIDFIGQKAPTSRLALLLLDLTVLGLQCVMLAVHGEREILRKFVTPGSRVVGSSVAPANAAVALTPQPPPRPPPSTEDLDAEERGVPGRERRVTEGANGIELQPMLRPRRSPGSTARRPDMRDYMISGNASLGDFHVLHPLTASSDDYQTAAAQSLQTIGYAARLARLVTEPAQAARLSAQTRQPAQ